MTAEHPESPPLSVNFVEYVLEQEGPLSHSEIQEETGISDSSVTRALNHLRGMDRVKRVDQVEDGRRKVYELK